MKPGDDESFDWVAALRECSVVCKFAEMSCDAEKQTKARDKYELDTQGSKARKSTNFDFSPINNNHFIVMVSQETSGCIHKVHFVLEEKKIIVTRWGNGGKKINEFFVTLTLNDDGECMFKIDDEGEFRMWHVMRRALEPLFLM